jgi:uncharacterized coiled-coil protein SlyX
MTPDEVLALLRLIARQELVIAELNRRVAELQTQSE